MAGTGRGKRLTVHHKAVQARIAVELIAALRPLWRLLAPDRLAETRGPWLAAVLPVLQRAHESSQLAAAQYYAAFRAAEIPAARPVPVTAAGPAKPGGGARVRVLEPVDFDAAGAARALMATGPGGIAAGRDRAKVFVTQSQAAVRVAGDGGRAWLQQAVELDKAALGWARVTADNPCWFCAMLASLGPWYKSGNSFAASDPRFTGDAGKVKVHDGCRCTLEPIYDLAADLPGKNTQYAELWRTATEGLSGAEALRAFRRAFEQQQRAEQKQQQTSMNGQPASSPTEAPPVIAPPAPTRPAAPAVGSPAELDVTADPVVAPDPAAPVGSSGNPRHFPDSRSGPAYAAAWHENDADKLPMDQRDAVRSYSLGGYRPMNESLRTSKGNVQTPRGTALDAFYASVPATSEWLVLTRGTGLEQFGLPHNGDPFTLLGSTVTEWGYTSTSIADEPEFEGAARMIIRVPPGTKAIYLDGEPGQPDRTKLSSIPGEREVLLARGTHYRVLAVYHRRDTRWRYDIVCEVVGQDVY